MQLENTRVGVWHNPCIVFVEDFMSGLESAGKDPGNTLDERLSYGPGMRWQRISEAVFIVAALLTEDVRWAYVPLASVALQVISMRLSPVAFLVATFYRRPPRARVEGVYFDGQGNRGGCVISVIVHLAGIYLVESGPAWLGWLFLAMPAGSFLLAPTVGFCLGCTVYVSLRLLAYRLGWVSKSVKGGADVQFEAVPTGRQ